METTGKMGDIQASVWNSSLSIPDAEFHSLKGKPPEAGNKKFKNLNLSGEKKAVCFD